jgi:hypothetical protein
LAAAVRTTFAQASAQLESIASAWAEADEDIRKLKMMPDMDPVQERLSMSESKVKDLEHSAQKIVNDAERVAKQMVEVRGLIGPGVAGRQDSPLEEALASLESTAQAYRELE